MLEKVVFLLMVFTFCTKVLETQAEQRVGASYGAHITSYPFVVSLRRKSCEICSFEHYCGGTIYTRKAIITAASCLKNADPHHTQIIAGATFREGAAHSGEVYPVERITLHENESVDLAIVHLAIEISFEPIAVASVLPEAGKRAVLVGWGQLTEFDANNEQLKEVHVPLIENAICQHLYSWHKVESHEICAGYLAGGADACDGDAGSPLLFNQQIIGIASWGYGCGRPNNPGVYTNAVALRDWIESHA